VNHANTFYRIEGRFTVNQLPMPLAGGSTLSDQSTRDNGSEATGQGRVQPEIKSKSQCLAMIITRGMS
jgi:hypothetical protein